MSVSRGRENLKMSPWGLGFQDTDQIETGSAGGMKGILFNHIIYLVETQGSLFKHGSRVESSF